VSYLSDLQIYVAYFDLILFDFCCFCNASRDLNDNLKQVFHNVLKTRGINSSLADTIVDHLTNQYQDEYIDWLKKVRDFLVR
jgi:hypothetical protein